MSKTKSDKKIENLPQVGLPDLLKKHSKFSGGGSQFGVPGQKSPVNKFTPAPVRFTQHKGGN